MQFNTVQWQLSYLIVKWPIESDKQTRTGERAALNPLQRTSISLGIRNDDVAGMGDGSP